MTLLLSRWQLSIKIHSACESWWDKEVSIKSVCSQPMKFNSQCKWADFCKQLDIPGTSARLVQGQESHQCCPQLLSAICCQRCQKIHPGSCWLPQTQLVQGILRPQMLSPQGHLDCVHGSSIPHSWQFAFVLAASCTDKKLLAILLDIGKELCLRLALLQGEAYSAKHPLALVKWGRVYCLASYRFATVLATKTSISFTLPLWKNPKFDKSAASPSRIGSVSPLCFLSIATAVSFMTVAFTRALARLLQLIWMFGFEEQ